MPGARAARAALLLALLALCKLAVVDCQTPESPAGAAFDAEQQPPDDVISSLTAYFGLVGYGLLPFTPSERADLERAMNQSIARSQVVRLRSIVEYQWDSMPRMLRVIAVKWLSVSSLQSQQARRDAAATAAAPTADGPSQQQQAQLGLGSPTGAPAQGTGGSRRRRRAARRALLQEASSDEVITFGPRGPPDGGVIATVDIYTSPAVRANTSLLQWELAASLRQLREQLNYSGPTIAIDLLGTGLPGTVDPNFEEALAAGSSSGGSSSSSSSGSAPGGAGSPLPAAEGSSSSSAATQQGQPSGEASPPSEEDSSSVPVGLVVGVSVGAAVLAALLGVGLWKRRRVAALLGCGGDGGGGFGRGSPQPAPDVETLLDASQVSIAQRPDGSDWLLGEGAMGSVYRGLLHGKLPVAIKVLRNANGGSTVAQEVNQEIALLKACRNSYIVQFQGVVLQQDSIWLVTELCETDLFTAIGNGKVSWHKRGRKIALDVARGLHFLHCNKVVHLDLKSPNVLLTAAGAAKICDVGLSRILTSTHVTQATLGTFAWCAPEVLLAQRATAAADIFSFGVLLWEMITGQRPVRGQLREVVAPADCSADVADLLKRCLDSRPEERPSAAEVIEVLSRGLGRHASGESTSRDLLLASSTHTQLELLRHQSSAVPSSTNSAMALLPKAVVGALDFDRFSTQEVLAFNGSASTASADASMLTEPAPASTGGSAEASVRSWQPLHSAGASPPSSGELQEQQQQQLQEQQQQRQHKVVEEGTPLPDGQDQAAKGETFDQAYARLLAQTWEQAERACGKSDNN